MSAPLSPILSEFRERLQTLYGTQLDRLVLFGSHARGDADPGSDIEVLVVVLNEAEIEQKRERADQIIHELCLKHDIVISCVFTNPECLVHSGMPFYRNVRREGVPI